MGLGDLMGLVEADHEPKNNRLNYNKGEGQGLVVDTLHWKVYTSEQSYPFKKLAQF